MENFESTQNYATEEQQVAISQQLQKLKKCLQEIHSQNAVNDSSKQLFLICLEEDSQQCIKIIDNYLKSSNRKIFERDLNHMLDVLNTEIWQSFPEVIATIKELKKLISSNDLTRNNIESSKSTQNTYSTLLPILETQVNLSSSLISLSNNSGESIHPLEDEDSKKIKEALIKNMQYLINLPDTKIFFAEYENIESCVEKINMNFFHVGLLMNVIIKIRDHFKNTNDEISVSADSIIRCYNILNEHHKMLKQTRDLPKPKQFPTRDGLIKKMSSQPMSPLSTPNPFVQKSKQMQSSANKDANDSSVFIEEKVDKTSWHPK